MYRLTSRGVLAIARPRLTGRAIFRVSAPGFRYRIVSNGYGNPGNRGTSRCSIARQTRHALAHHEVLLKCAKLIASVDIFSLSAHTRPCNYWCPVDTAHDALPKHNGTPDHRRFHTITNWNPAATVHHAASSGAGASVSSGSLPGQ